MSRNLVICCDGTGNEYGPRDTDVVKAYELLHPDDPTRQVAFCDPGVGTAPRPGAVAWVRRRLSVLAGLAFGAGLNRNVADACRWLVRNYAEGDRVFLFGFSRSAYCVRALTGLLHMFGLLRPGNENLIACALKYYNRRDPDWTQARGFQATFARPCRPHFVGVWDTVKSVGLWDTLKVNLLRLRKTLPYTYRMPDMALGRHAVSRGAAASARTCGPVPTPKPCSRSGSRARTPTWAAATPRRDRRTSRCAG